MKKQMGIEVHLIVNADERDITEKELDNFQDDLIDLVERNKWWCGGGMNLLDVNEDTEEEAKGINILNYSLYKNGVHLKDGETIKELCDWLENIINGSLYQGICRLRDGWIPEEHSQLSGYTVETKI